MKQRIFLSILCLFLISLGGFASVSAQTCIENRKNFVPNETYDGNRRLILSSLPSNAADGFYNGSIGQVPNRVYAVGMCIPRADPNDCSACIEGASDWLIHDCTNQRDAYYWALDPTLCLVRYSNISFSGSAAYWEIVPRYLVMNTADINSNLTEFKMIWEGFIHGIIAAASASKNHCKDDVVALTPFQNIYALMQCTPDISSGDCDNCMRQSVIDYQSCCANKTGGYVIRPICFFRWQLFTFSKAFGNITLAPPPSPPVQRQPPSVGGDRVNTTDNNSREFSVGLIVVIFALVVFVIIFGILARVLCWKRNSYQEVELNPFGITTVRSLKFNFKTIETATDSFSERNKIGRGGFGEVFKGTLPSGKVIAVKRLLRATKQSEHDFKNEVFVVAKLEHTNLVRLFGFSVKGEERILVYEFMPNRTLDHFLFGVEPPIEQGRLDWTKLYNLIRGIIQGILHLHQDSRPPIIHRDLKAANILLDADMNPKICDFGMARIFGMSQSVDNTGRVIGTP